MALYLVRAQSTHKDIRMCSLHHTHACMHPNPTPYEDFISCADLDRYPLVFLRLLGDISATFTQGEY